LEGGVVGEGEEQGRGGGEGGRQEAVQQIREGRGGADRERDERVELDADDARHDQDRHDAPGHGLDVAQRALRLVGAELQATDEKDPGGREFRERLLSQPEPRRGI